MPLIEYVKKKFQARTLKIIGQANAIIEEYGEQGYSLTLRQVYYQFVARGFLENTQRNYNKLGTILSGARLAGLVDWDAIEDRTRNLEAFTTWSSPESIVGACAQQFRLDLWAEQAVRIEVWVEKEALVGIVGQIARQLRVDYMACRGYMSQSEMWNAAKTRFQEYQDGGQQVLLLHLGDHDPSGIDMTQDIRKRLSLFMASPPAVKRLALNMDQVEQYQPPPNPAKATDTRYKSYAAEYGDESWELDALEPAVLDGLITKAVLAERNKALWKRGLGREAKARQRLDGVVEHWSAVAELVDDLEM